MFEWQCCVNALPIASRLMYYLSNYIICCHGCGVAVKLYSYMLLRCSLALQVWAGSNFLHFVEGIACHLFHMLFSMLMIN